MSIVKKIDKKVYWIGNPECCQLCGFHLKRQFVDGKTKLGAFAIMCISCYASRGIGSGQLYQQEGDQWIKIGG